MEGGFEISPNTESNPISPLALENGAEQKSLENEKSLQNDEKTGTDIHESRPNTIENDVENVFEPRSDGVSSNEPKTPVRTHGLPKPDLSLPKDPVKTVSSPVTPVNTADPPVIPAYPRGSLTPKSSWSLPKEWLIIIYLNLFI